MQGKQAQLLAQYYAILGVRSTSSLDEIKDAYRAKAKKLHPDVNPSANAHQEFIALKKAYQYLVDFKTGKIPVERITPPRPATQANRPQQRPNTAQRTNTQRPTTKQRNAKQNPYAQKARPQYRQKKTVNPEVLRDEKHGAILFATMIVALFIPMYFILFLKFPSQDGLPGLFMAIAMFVITLPLFATCLRWLKKYSKADRKEAYDRVKNSVTAQIISGSLIAFFGFVFYASNIFIPFWALLALQIIPSILILYFWPKKSKKLIWRRKFLAFNCWPFALQMFYILNFYISFNQQTENYAYKPHEGIFTNSVILPNDKYASYYQIRNFFSDYSNVAEYTVIEFKTATGLFGIKVLKNYHFKNYNKDKLYEGVIINYY